AATDALLIEHEVAARRPRDRARMTQSHPRPALARRIAFEDRFAPRRGDARSLIGDVDLDFRRRDGRDHFDVGVTRRIREPGERVRDLVECAFEIAMGIAVAAHPTKLRRYPRDVTLRPAWRLRLPSTMTRAHDALPRA